MLWSYSVTRFGDLSILGNAPWPYGATPFYTGADAFMYPSNESANFLSSFVRTDTNMKSDRADKSVAHLLLYRSCSPGVSNNSLIRGSFLDFSAPGRSRRELSALPVLFWHL